jgi:spore germination protein GerM
MNNKKIILWASVTLLFIAASAGGYYFFRNFRITKQSVPAVTSQLTLPGEGDTTVIRIYYPVYDHLEMTEKTIFRKTGNSAVAEAVIEEFFKLPLNGIASAIPKNVRLLGIYRDQNQILYLDLSDELRRNFQGDAISEYLLIRGIFDSLIYNIPDMQDVKILVEGKETDSLGGHLYLKFPLKNYISYEPKKETAVSDDQ